MSRKVDSSKHDLAFLLFMAGELQKDICERVATTSKTLQRWIDDGGWKEKRSAKNITRTELVNKALQTINNLLEDSIENKTDISDQLSKMGAFIERLDKKNSVVDDMETFIGFSKQLKTWSEDDKSITHDLIKTINKLQDKYITERISQ